MGLVGEDGLGAVDILHEHVEGLGILRTIGPAGKVQYLVAVYSAEEEGCIPILVAQGIIPSESKQRLGIPDNLAVTFGSIGTGYHTTLGSIEHPCSVGLESGEIKTVESTHGLSFDENLGVGVHYTVLADSAGSGFLIVEPLRGIGKLGDIVAVEGDGRCGGPAEIALLDGDIAQGELCSVAVHLARVGEQGVELIRRSRDLVIPEQVGSVAVIYIQATVDTVVEQAVVRTEVVLVFLLPLEVGIHVLGDCVGIDILSVVPEGASVGEHLDGTEVAGQVVAGDTETCTELEVVHPADVLHEIFSADAPSCTEGREISPLMVRSEAGRTFAAYRC